jgi:type I restriction enzyme S subunit
MNFKTTTIGEIASVQTGPFGSQLHNEDYVLIGTPIVTVEHLGQRKMTRQNLPCVSDADKERLSKYPLEYGDLGVSRVGSVDRCSWVGQEEDGWMFSGRCLRVRPLDKEAVYHKYLYYFFTLEETKDFVRNIAVGATMPSINTRLLSEVPIEIPSIGDQKTIADTLSALDDRIEENKAINNHLELMAQAIFAEQCSEGETALLSDILTICYGKDHKRLNEGKIPCYGSGGIMRYVDEALYSGESVLIPRKGSLNNVLYISEPFWTVDTMFYTHMTSPNVAKFVYFTVRNLDLAGMNVGSAVPSMTTAVLNALEIVLPSDDNLASFEEVVSPMFSQIQANNTESACLAALRDTLLPRLMSGELSVTDVNAK